MNEKEAELYKKLCGTIAEHLKGQSMTKGEVLNVTSALVETAYRHVFQGSPS